MSRCVYENKLHYNRWCSKACMYCTATQQETCWHKKVPDTNVVKTNADHIRSMTDEELGDFLDDIYCHGWNYGSLDRVDSDPDYHEWLKQPYKEDT